MKKTLLLLCIISLTLQMANAEQGAEKTAEPSKKTILVKPEELEISASRGFWRSTLETLSDGGRYPGLKIVVTKSPSVIQKYYAFDSQTSPNEWSAKRSEAKKIRDQLNRLKASVKDDQLIEIDQDRLNYYCRAGRFEYLVDDVFRIVSTAQAHK